MISGNSHRYATVGQLRTYVVLGAAALFLLLTGMNVLSVDRDRVRCETANGARRSEMHQRETLVSVNVGRVNNATTPEDRNTNLIALASYRENLVELLDSQRAVALDPDVHVPGVPELLGTVELPKHPLNLDENAVTADCSETNPYPPPVSWFSN